MVITDEGMLRREMSAPLSQPQAAPVAKPAASARTWATPCAAIKQKTAVPRAMIEGKDRVDFAGNDDEG